MKKYFVFFSILIYLAFSLFVSPQQSFAASGTCLNPNQECGPGVGNTTCCPFNGQQYFCEGILHGRAGAIDGHCRLVKKGACGDLGASCSIGTGHDCCPVAQSGPNKGKPMICAISAQKCILASVNHSCQNEGQKCGNGKTAATSGSCCSLVKNNQTLSCVDSSGKVVNVTNQTGTCKYISLKGSGPAPLPPPPSPPCLSWTGGQCNAVASALGNLPTDPNKFIVTIFAILLSVSGGIALLLIIKAGYQLMTSQGKPQQIQEGRDQLVAAIVGLVFLIFSFVILQLIGFDILHIPGFGP